MYTIVEEKTIHAVFALYLFLGKTFEAKHLTASSEDNVFWYTNVLIEVVKCKNQLDNMRSMPGHEILNANKRFNIIYQIAIGWIRKEH